MKPAEKRNPLSMIQLAGYDLTEKGRFNENLDMLSALKTAQLRFLKHIVRLHPEEVKRPDDLRKCGDWIFFRRYETGERFFAGGYTCHSRFCLPCSFRRAYVSALELYKNVRAYVSALELYKNVRVMMERNPNLVPGHLLHPLISFGDLLKQYRVLKRRYRSILKSHSRFFPDLYGSIGGYGFSVFSDRFGPSFAVNEFILVDEAKGPPVHPEYRVSSDDLFRVIFEVFLCDAVNYEGNLTFDQQFDVMQIRYGSQRFEPYGCFSNFVPPDNLASDPVDDALADQPFSEEQYRYDRELKAYVLEKVNTGDDMQFPFAVQVPRGRGVQTHLKRQNKAIKRQRFSRLV